jgi:hypothetical protein
LNEESGHKEQLRFFCDAMLGRLARELRLLGLDVEYRRGIGGMRVYREARSHNRVLLTRNKRLAQLPGVYFVNAEEAPAQVAEIRAKFGSDRPGAVEPQAGEAQDPELNHKDTKTQRVQTEEPRGLVPPRLVASRGEGLPRCLACNEPLQKITRDQARPSIPFFIYQIHHEFTRCPRCKRVYWPGSHAKSMEQRAQAGHAAPGERQATPGAGSQRRYGRGFRRRTSGPERRAGDAGNEAQRDGK